MVSHKRFAFSSCEELAAALKDIKVNIPLSGEIDVLREPLLVGTKTIPNRLAVQPMEGCDATPDGKPGELTQRRYRRFAAGGAGLIWFEAAAVVREGRANPRQLVLSRDNLRDMENLLKGALREAEKKYGSDRNPYTVLQLTHSGRYSRPESGLQPVYAVKNPYLDNSRPGNAAGRLITDGELEELEECFADAAVMAGEIGFDAVDIKSCHGYLIADLLSARMREGYYGGSFENRTRFLLNCIDKIKKQAGDALEIAPRLSTYDAVPYPYGWGVNTEDHRCYDMSEPVRLVKLLAEKGIKMLNITSGNPYYNPHIARPYDSGPYIPAEHPLCGVGRMLNMSREIQEAVPGMAVVATGFSWLREFGAHCAAGGILDGWFSLAGFGRQSFACPDFPVDIMTKGGMNRKKCCIACGKCSEIMRFGGMTGCVVHDADVYMPIYREVIQGKPSITGEHTAEHV